MSIDDCGDNTFGPIVATNDCRYGLDFTLLFEEAFLVIASCSIFIILATVRTILLCRHTVDIRWNRNLGLKLVLACFLLVAQLVNLVLWTLKPYGQTRTTLAAASLELLSSLMICVLLLTECMMSIQPSMILSIFLALTVLFDIVRIRSISMIIQMNTILITTAISTGFKASLLAVEFCNRETILDPPDSRRKSPEGQMGILSDSMMLWLLPIFWSGYRKSIQSEDLPSVPDSLYTSAVAEHAVRLWGCARQGRKHVLAMTTFWLVRKTMLQQMLPRLCLVGFNIAQPFLIERFLTDISSNMESSIYFYIGAFAFVYIGIAVSTTWYQVFTNRTVTIMRGGLISLIYAKTLQLSAADLVDSSAVSLITSDVERIATSIRYIQNFWADIIQIGLATYILSTYISVVCVAAVIVALVSSVAAGQLSKMIGPRQRVWFDKGRERIQSTTKALDEIKSIKWSGLEIEVQSNISELRSNQISVQKRFRVAQIMMICLGNFPGIATPFVVFLIFAIVSYVNSDPPLPLAQVFAALSVLSLLIGPVGDIVGMLSNFGASLSCFSTIQDYLLKSHHSQAHPESTSNETEKENAKIIPNTGGIDHNDYQMYARYRNVSIAIQDLDGPRKVLNDLTFCVPAGYFTLITGPTGCGKSTLLKTLFKELVPISGVLSVRPGDIAFCSQSPWVMNATIRENIIGPYSFDQSWYANVLNACCLSNELQKFAQGDETIVGSKGGSLSGGQMARLTLARAVYSKASVVILDEPFSSLDSRTEEKCFRLLLGPSGLLSDRSTTVVLASVRKKYLGNADNAIVLDHNGQRVVSDSTRHLDIQNYPEFENYEPLETIDQADTIIDTGTSSPKIDNDQPVIQDGPSQPPVLRMKDMRLIPYYLQAMALWLFAILLLMMLGQVIFIAIQPLWLNYWIEYNLKSPNQNVGYYFGIYAVFVVLSLALLCGCACVFFLVLVPLSSQTLHDRLLSTTLEAPLSFFQHTKTGTILNHFTQDLMLVDVALPLALLLGLENGMASLAQLILTSISTGYVALAIPGIILALYIVQHVYLRTSKQIRLLDLAAKAPIYDHITETISGISTIRLLSWQDYFTSKNYTFIDDSQSPYYIMLSIQKWLTLVLNLIVAGLAIILTATVIALRDHINPGLIGVSLISIVGLGEKLSYFITFWTSLETSLGAISRIKSYTDETPKHDSHTQPDMDPDWPPTGTIQIANLSAGYPSQTILHEINLAIPHGQKVKLTGPSGSGKTSLAATLLRLIDIKAGHITIDGKDISMISARSLHQAIFALPQTLTFISKTIRGNLTSRIQHDVTGERLEQVLRSVSLWPRISSLPDGLNTVWSTDLLSPGQRQLFAFAQALLSRCPIVVIDEISSYLDDETVNIIQRLLVEEFSDKTVLMITHDTRHGFACDRIIRLDGGRIVSDEMCK